MSAADRHEDAPKLGTFGGVFTPSILTILGLVMFLRLGYVTGNVGLAQMLLILGLATSVSVLTTMSLAAIATNLRVGGGGVYFVVSRTLGPVFGGSIGLVLYIAMAVSVAFYAIGFGEALASIVGTDNGAFPQMAAAAVVVALLGLAWLGADIATRLQYVVMACLALAIAGYFAGVLPDLDAGLLSDNVRAPLEGDTFWVGFAIFFPAITGFTQGVAMSGDLRTPSRSITVGTFAAIGLSTVVYLAVIVTLAAAVPLEGLREDTAIMRRLAISPALIDLGVVAATLSSAIASLLGAPRILQRIAADRLVKPLDPFAVGTGVENNPRRAVLLTGAIALVTVAAGDLNLIAPIISMFFLASYGMINFATYSEARAANTSFRPTFRWFDWRLSLLGTLACLGAILAINPLAGALAGAAVFGLYKYLLGSVEHTRWADSTFGFHAAQVRSNLKSMTSHDAARDWRPCTVAFVPRDPLRRERLMTVASWFEGGAGLTTAARIVAGRGPLARKHAARVDIEFQREIAQAKLAVFRRVLVAHDLEAGVTAMLQAHGIGALRPNLALFSWYDPAEPDRANAADYTRMLQTGTRLSCNVAVVHAPDDGWERIPATPRTAASVVVWWSDDRTGQLLTMLAWLCTRDSVWARAEITVWVVGSDPDRVRSLLDEARITATVAGLADPDAFVDIAADAGLALAPLRIHKEASLGPGDVPVDELVARLPLAVFVHAAVEVELDTQPDESAVAAIAEARDRATEASLRADELDQEASTVMVQAELLRLEFEANGRVADGELEETSRQAQRAHRKYLDARSRADEALRLVSELDPNASNETLDPSVWLQARRAEGDRRSTR